MVRCLPEEPGSGSRLTLDGSRPSEADAWGAGARDSAETREALRSSDGQAARQLSPRSHCCSSAEDVSDESTARAPRSNERSNDPRQVQRGGGV